jgi:hypothetical protein
LNQQEENNHRDTEEQQIRAPSKVQAELDDPATFEDRRMTRQLVETRKPSEIQAPNRCQFLGRIPGNVSNSPQQRSPLAPRTEDRKLILCAVTCAFYITF